MSILTTPNINPETGHEANMSNPRPRDEIYREILASHQMNPNTSLSDIYYRLQFILKDLEPFVKKELKQSKKQ